MDVSVIIPTFNGASRISVLLSALMKQSWKDFEVVVVVDGSTDRTEEVLKSFEGSFAQFKIIRQQNKGRSVVRNRGAIEAVGELLIFFDDDMEPDLLSVRRHVQWHSQNDGLLSGNQVEYPSEKKTDVQNYKAFLTTKWTQKYHNELTRLSFGNLFFTAANCSVSKTIFRKLGGFDERLTDAEDYDLAYRALKKEIPVFFDKLNIAIHHDNITVQSYLRRLRAYGKAHDTLLQINPERTIGPVRSYWIKKIIWAMFAHKTWVSAIDRGWLRMLPSSIRYRIYDAIFHSLGVLYPTKKV